MRDDHLFHAEIQALSAARAVQVRDGLEAEQYRAALRELTTHYERLVRDTRRLIRHGDRTEAELTLANNRLRQLGAELDYKARHDNLTGVLNRGAIFELATAYLTQRALSLIVLDIDFFKRINDSFGHPMGDAVIRELVERLSEGLEGQGDIGRVGGEEFTILLPDVSQEDATDIARRLCRVVGEQPFACLPAHPVTASFGVGWASPACAFEVAYRLADEALYLAKRHGRNCVVANTEACSRC